MTMNLPAVPAMTFQSNRKLTMSSQGSFKLGAKSVARWGQETSRVCTMSSIVMQGRQRHVGQNRFRPHFYISIITALAMISFLGISSILQYPQYSGPANIVSSSRLAPTVSNSLQGYNNRKAFQSIENTGGLSSKPIPSIPSNISQIEGTSAKVSSPVMTLQSNWEYRTVSELAGRDDHTARQDKNLRDITISEFTMNGTVVPFVYMVHKRVGYLKQAIDSLRQSDFPKNTVPLIISHDGHVPEMMKYVDSLKEEFQIIQIFHPFSCYDHPDTFPGDDPNLNHGYNGDSFGNPRSTIVCCKHHFSWMLTTVFSIDIGNSNVENFMFMEEDYIVGPSVYHTVVQGLNVMKQFQNETDGGFLGIGFDSAIVKNGILRSIIPVDAYFAAPFRTGPMTLSRSIFALLQMNSEFFCTIDEYNWDWAIVHMAQAKLVPHTLIVPVTEQTKHIGFVGGMHSNQAIHDESGTVQFLNKSFQGKAFYGKAYISPLYQREKYGGWGHPKDHEHCIRIFRGAP